MCSSDLERLIDEMRLHDVAGVHSALAAVGALFSLFSISVLSLSVVTSARIPPFSEDSFVGSFSYF